MTISTAKSAFWKGVRDSAPFVPGLWPVWTAVWRARRRGRAQCARSNVFLACGLCRLCTVHRAPVDARTYTDVDRADLSTGGKPAGGDVFGLLTPYLGDAPLWQRACAAYLTVDQAYALSMIEFERRAEWGTRERMAYFFGTNGLVAPAWMAATITGALVGASIPDSLGLDFVLPIAFLAMIGPMLRTPAHVVACFTACAVSLPATLMPYNLGLIIAGIAGMMAGAQAEVWFERKSAAAEAKQ